MAEVDVRINEETAQKLKLKQGGELTAHLDGKKIIIERENKGHERDQQLAIRYASVVAIISFVVTLGNFLYQHIRVVPITGGNSISQLTIYLGVFFGTLGFLGNVIRMKRSQRFQLRWPHSLTLTTAYGIIGFMSVSLVMKLLTLSFVGARLDIYTASVLITIFSAIVAYFLMTAGVNLNFNTIVTVLTLTLVGGVLLAMISNGKTEWWQYNFSYLGTNAAMGQGWIFNFTLIFSALIMLALFDYLFTLLGATYAKNNRLFWLRWLFNLVALTLGGVGIVPNNAGWQHIVHTYVAQALVFLILIMIIVIRWLLPDATREFLIISYVIAIGLVIADYLFQGVHYFSLTIFELLAFAIAFSWLMLLLQTLRGQITTVTESFSVKIETQN